MFETTEPGKGWDGLYNGKPQVMDVYSWIVEAESENGQRFKEMGNSILLRQIFKLFEKHGYIRKFFATNYSLKKLMLPNATLEPIKQIPVKNASNSTGLQTG